MCACVCMCTCVWTSSAGNFLERKGQTHRQLKSLFRGHCEMRSVQTFPSEVCCSQRGQARSLSGTDGICDMPPACWKVFLSNVLRAWRWRKALGKHTNLTSRGHLGGERHGTPTPARALPHPQGHWDCRRTSHCAPRASRAPRESAGGSG